jgi:chemotaxis protein methyltransferase CheR
MSESPAAVAELAALIEEASGNVIPPGHFPFLAETARRRAATLHLDGVRAYVTALGRGELAGEWSRLLPHVTVKESFLFRHPQQFAALASTIVPSLAAARAGRRSLAVWSAGCARGEEPATLAIVLAEAAELAGWEWRILATDVDEEALAAAASGSFGARAVSRVPAELRARYLLPRGDGYQLHPALARRIEYRPLNLVRAPLGLSSAAFDLVFLRNVLIYFRAEVQGLVAAAVASVLARHGRLFLGPAETLWQVSADLEPIDLGDCFCYAHAGERPARATAAAMRAPAAGPGRPATGPERFGSGPRPAAAAPAPPLPAPSEPEGTRERLAAAARLLAAGRVDDAAGPVGTARLADPSDPGVHALEGFLHDVSGRTQMAVAAYRAALFLDAGLFQVRLLLADALRRLGHERRAETEYREVLAALAAGRADGIEALAGLGWPDRAEASRRAREALHGGSPPPA